MKIVVKPSARKDLLKLEHQIRKRISLRIDQLADPFAQGTEKLSGEKGYRVRVGNYRIVFNIYQKEKIIEITSIGHRKEIYKHLN